MAANSDRKHFAARQQGFSCVWLSPRVIYRLADCFNVSVRNLFVVPSQLCLPCYSEHGPDCKLSYTIFWIQYKGRSRFSTFRSL